MKKKIVLTMISILAIVALFAGVAAAPPPPAKIVTTIVPAAVTGVVQNGTDLVISGVVPNMPPPWGWTAFISKKTYNHTTKIITIEVKRRGSDCPTCGISNPPFVPYTLTTAIGNYPGYVVKVNGVYWVILQ